MASLYAIVVAAALLGQVVDREDIGLAPIPPPKDGFTWRVSIHNVGKQAQGEFTLNRARGLLVDGWSCEFLPSGVIKDGPARIQRLKIECTSIIPRETHHALITHTPLCGEVSQKASKLWEARVLSMSGSLSLRIGVSKNNLKPPTQLIIDCIRHNIPDPFNTDRKDSGL